MNITKLVSNSIKKEILKDSLLFGSTNKNSILSKKGSSYFATLSKNTIKVSGEPNYENCNNYEVYELLKDFYINVKGKSKGNLLNKYILFNKEATDMITFDEVGGFRTEYSGFKDEIYRLKYELLEEGILKETDLTPIKLQVLLFAWMWVQSYTPESRFDAVMKYLIKVFSKIPREWKEVDSKFIYRGVVTSRKNVNKLLENESFEFDKFPVVLGESWSISAEEALNFITNGKTLQKYEDGANYVCIVLKKLTSDSKILLNLNKIYHLMRFHTVEIEQEVILSNLGLEEVTIKDLYTIW